MISNSTDQKDDHVAIPIHHNPTSTDTTHILDPIHTLKSSLDNSNELHHPDVDSNTVEFDHAAILSFSLPTIPEALHINNTQVISNASGRYQRANSSAFQEIDQATLQFPGEDPTSDPLTTTTAKTTAAAAAAATSSPSYFNNPCYKFEQPSASGFVLESPSSNNESMATMTNTTTATTPNEFEMQRFNAYDGSSASTVKVVTTAIPAPTNNTTTPSAPLSSPTSSSTTITSTLTPPETSKQNSFFTGWMAIPPSLAGRPKLSPEQENYFRREYERGPVSSMWPKTSEDIENQGQSSTTMTTLANWLASWGIRTFSHPSTTPSAPPPTPASFILSNPNLSASTVDNPLHEIVVPLVPPVSHSGRRKSSQAH
ncbi:hypothetical protein FBU30_000993 [Linnemannia zychae]|nr:hypothetical protein FBU30_000993 [Linnemannia zychae]